MSILALTEMSDAELDELSSGIAYARLERSGERYTDAERELWRTIGSIFPSHKKLPIDHFVRGMDGSKGFGVQRFLHCASEFETVLDQACADGTRKATRIAMRRFMLDCLCNWLKGANVPLSPKTLLYSMDKLAHAIEQEYPGYIAAGMLSFVLDPLPRSD